MPTGSRHLVSRTQATQLAPLLLLVGALTGCQSLSSPTAASSMARLRVIDLSPDSDPVDIYQGTHPLASNLTYGAVSSYIPIAPGTAATTVVRAGSRQTLASIKGVFVAGGQYTVVLRHSAATLEEVVLPDQPSSAPLSAPAVRLLHEAERTGPVDIYLVPAGQRLASLTPIAANLASGAGTDYLPTPTGLLTAVIVPAGTVPGLGTRALHRGTQIDYSNGSARTLILLDAPSSLGAGVRVIATTDAEPLP